MHHISVVGVSLPISQASAAGYIVQLRSVTHFPPGFCRLTEQVRKPSPQPLHFSAILRGTYCSFPGVEWQLLCFTFRASSILQDAACDVELKFLPSLPPFSPQFQHVRFQSYPTR